MDNMIYKTITYDPYTNYKKNRLHFVFRGQADNLGNFEEKRVAWGTFKLSRLPYNGSADLESQMLLGMLSMIENTTNRGDLVKMREKGASFFELCDEIGKKGVAVTRLGIPSWEYHTESPFSGLF